MRLYHTKRVRESRFNLPFLCDTQLYYEDSRGRPTYLTRDVNKLSNRLKELGDCNTLAQTEFMTKAKEEQELKMMNLYGYEDFMADLKIERSRELVLIRTRRREA